MGAAQLLLLELLQELVLGRPEAQAAGHRNVAMQKLVNQTPGSRGRTATRSSRPFPHENGFPERRCNWKPRFAPLLQPRLARRGRRQRGCESSGSTRLRTARPGNFLRPTRITQLGRPRPCRRRLGTVRIEPGSGAGVRRWNQTLGRRAHPQQPLLASDGMERPSRIVSSESSVVNVVTGRHRGTHVSLRPQAPPLRVRLLLTLPSVAASCVAGRGAPREPAALATPQNGLLGLHQQPVLLPVRPALASRKTLQLRSYRLHNSHACLRLPVAHA